MDTKSPQYIACEKTGNLIAAKNTKIEEQTSTIAALIKALETITNTTHESNAISDNQARYKAHLIAAEAMNKHAGTQYETNVEMVEVITWDEKWQPVRNLVPKLKFKS